LKADCGGVQVFGFGRRAYWTEAVEPDRLRLQQQLSLKLNWSGRVWNRPVFVSAEVEFETWPGTVPAAVCGPV
jgi:hypothetical protein